jgi:hypothetical protein
MMLDHSTLTIDRTNCSHITAITIGGSVGGSTTTGMASTTMAIPIIVALNECSPPLSCIPSVPVPSKGECCYWRIRRCQLSRRVVFNILSICNPERVLVYNSPPELILYTWQYCGTSMCRYTCKPCSDSIPLYHFSATNT